jgi:hypothetical protein
MSVSTDVMQPTHLYVSMCHLLLGASRVARLNCVGAPSCIYHICAPTASGTHSSSSLVCHVGGSVGSGCLNADVMNTRAYKTISSIEFGNYN